MNTLARINPLTYGVDAMRAIMLEGVPSRLPLAADIFIMMAITLAMLAMAVTAFSRQQS
jgi:ABC-type polysaccharide/polyol phosphate export permease